ncbi:MAG: response regulator, partial [Nitriliruptor sp.]
MQRPLRVVICDDDPAFCNLVRRVLRDHVDVLGTAASADEVVPLLNDQQPDVLLLDLQLGTQMVLEVLPQLLIASPHTMVAALSGLDAGTWEDQVLLAGAFVYYEKTSVLELPALLEKDVTLFES